MFEVRDEVERRQRVRRAARPGAGGGAHRLQRAAQLLHRVRDREVEREVDERRNGSRCSVRLPRVSPKRGFTS
jgi:hypothetical protein